MQMGKTLATNERMVVEEIVTVTRRHKRGVATFAKRRTHMPKHAEIRILCPTSEPVLWSQLCTTTLKAKPHECSQPSKQYKQVVRLTFGTRMVFRRLTQDFS
jgi:hypothetical protein